MIYADFHCHLGGSLPPSVLWQFACEYGVDTGHLNFEDFSEFMLRPVSDVSDFFGEGSKHSIAERIQAGPEAVRRSAYQAVSKSYRRLSSVGKKLTHIDLRFDPYKRLHPYLARPTRPRDVMSVILAALEGLSKASRHYDISTRLILCADRSSTRDHMMGLVDLALGTADGIDVCGLEDPSFMSESWVVTHHYDAYKKAFEHGLITTYHIGESMNGSAYALTVLRALGGFVTRIGHGISILNDLDNVSGSIELIRDATFEICPTSNMMVATRKFITESLINCILKDVKFVIATDNPALLSCTVLSEVEVAKSMVSEVGNDFVVELENRLSPATLSLM